MKKTIALFIMVLLCFTGCSSEKYNVKTIKLDSEYNWEMLGGTFSEGVVSIGKDGKFGFLDSEGNEVIPCIYTAVRNFSEGLAAVQNENKKWGYIDTKGNEVIPFIYDTATDFSEGLAEVSKDDVIFINKNGNEVFKQRFFTHREFSEGLLALEDTSNKWIYVDKEGKEIINVNYSEVYNFSDGLARVCKKYGGYGYIDKNGNEIVACKYDFANDFSEGFACVAKEIYQNGYIDILGNEVIACEYDEATDFVDGKATVKKGSKWGIIDKNGNVQFTLGNYRNVKHLGNGLFLAEGKKSGYIDEDGKEVIPCKYDTITDVSEGLVLAKKDGNFYIIKIDKI